MTKVAAEPSRSNVVDHPRRFDVPGAEGMDVVRRVEHDADIASLRREIDELRRALAEVAQGHSRDLPGADGFDPILTWVRTHREEVARRPGQWLAVDPQTNEIVLAEIDASAFELEVAAWIAKHTRDLYTLHTSLFV